MLIQVLPKVSAKQLKLYFMVMPKLLKVFIVEQKYLILSFILLNLFQELQVEHSNLLKFKLLILMLSKDPFTCFKTFSWHYILNLPLAYLE